jgi:acetyl-CoA C-acetyltransferase
MTKLAEDRVPVIIGVGQINDRPENLADGLDSIGLMLAALRDAEKDSGTDVLSKLDWLGVEDQMTFPNPAHHLDLAKQLPRVPREVVRTYDPSGDGPMGLLNEAANLIAAGRISVAATTGGEAFRTASKRAQEERDRNPGAAKADLMAEASAAIALPHAKPYGLISPSEIYPLYEQATRAAWGQTLEEAQAETGAIWSGNSKAAAANPYAWLRKETSAQEIIEPTADNRMINYPYTKLMVANPSVNQGAAVIVTSLAMAKKLGVAEDRIVYVGHGAKAYEIDDYLRRENFTESKSMAMSINKTLEFNGVTAKDLDHVELYSCFPCVPKMARRILDWPLDKPHSVYGGLTFGGAPVGNCMTHAACAMVDKLRADHKNAKGLIFANGGFASHSHTILLSRQPGKDADKVVDYDCQALADATRGPAPEFIESYEGPATIESYCMNYDRKGAPAYAAVVARTPKGDRFLAHVPGEDEAVLNFLAGAQGEPVGAAGRAVRMEDGRQRWTR